MDIQQAKEIVIKAGKQLVSSGLIARTWGNVSCRIDDKTFVITPSGRAYETLTPDEIVLVKMDDLSYEGDVKPSSEKGIHAQCYLLRPECNFVIHTHQANASIVSALGSDINRIEGNSREIIGDNVPLAAYGLPGTGKLRQGVVDALLRSDSKAVIMKHHGAVCLGADYDEAFAIANELELVCMKLVYSRYKTLTNKPAETFRDICNYAIDVKRRGEAEAAPIDAYDSERTGNVVVLKDKEGNEKAMIGLAKNYPIHGEAPVEMALHRAVYLRRPDVKAIIQSQADEVVAASKFTKKLRPLLDDFAQIAGVTVRRATFDPDNAERTAAKAAKALGKHRNAVLLKDNGAICVGPSRDEAEAAEMVTAKNCKTHVASQLFTTAKTIGKFDAVLMNVVYRLKYSKQKK